MYRMVSAEVDFRVIRDREMLVRMGRRLTELCIAETEKGDPLVRKYIPDGVS